MWIGLAKQRAARMKQTPVPLQDVLWAGDLLQEWPHQARLLCDGERVYYKGGWKLSDVYPTSGQLIPDWPTVVFSAEGPITVEQGLGYVEVR